MRTLLVATIVSCIAACSLSEPKGIGISDIDQTYSLGSIGANRVRLKLSDYSDGTEQRSAQVILDFASKTLERHEDTMEWQPTLAGYVTDSAIGEVVVGSGVNVSWPGRQRVLFALPDVIFAFWWHSAALDRVFIVYQNASITDYMVAACTSDGACVQGTAPVQPGPLDSHRPVEVWDEERLVALPLMCCVCITAEYYTFELADDGRPVLISVPPLATLGPVWYDTASNEVWSSAMRYTGYSPALEVVRYNYASHTSATVEIPASEVEAFFKGGGLPSWAIALIVLGAVGSLLVVAAALWLAKVRGKGREPSMDSVVSVASKPVA